MLVSIHIPKTAGTTFGTFLSDRYGRRLLKDYGDRPLSHPAGPRLARAVAAIPSAPARLDGFDAVHGHFLPLKYVAVRGDFVTWLRDPAQRILSRYHHYLRDVAAGRPLQDVAGLRPGLALAEFIEIPRFQDSYAKYFRGFPLRRVSCFGFSEDVAGGLARMQRRLGWDTGGHTAKAVNVNPARTGDRYDVPAAVQRRIERLNRADYRIWFQAREREGA